ncbi:MAG: hypothetical protein HYY84_05790 [Deltaproteobacteria bacterium]|nr:hypothetical protein [Deltaproteobacteria bacterium]
MVSKSIIRNGRSWAAFIFVIVSCGSQPPNADVPNSNRGSTSFPEQATFGSIHLTVRLTDQYDLAKATGLRLSIDGQSLPLQLQPSPPTRFVSSGRTFDIQTVDTNGDGKNDYVVSFTESPFDARREFEFIFNGKWNQAVRFRIECAVPSGASGVDVGSAQTTIDGQPIYFVADQTRSVKCAVDCRPGVTCRDR